MVVFFFSALVEQMSNAERTTDASEIDAIVAEKKKMDRPSVFGATRPPAAGDAQSSVHVDDREGAPTVPMSEQDAASEVAADVAASAEPEGAAAAEKRAANVIVVDIGQHAPTAADVGSIDDLRKLSVAQIRAIGAPLLVDVSARDRKNAAVEKVWRAIEASRAHRAD